MHGEFLFATQAWLHKSSIAADILGFEVSLNRQSNRPWAGAEKASGDAALASPVVRRSAIRRSTFSNSDGDCLERLANTSSQQERKTSSKRSSALMIRLERSEGS